MNYIFHRLIKHPHCVACLSVTVASLSRLVVADEANSLFLGAFTVLVNVSASVGLAIENNSLSLNQVTDIINGKRVLGAPNEIHEVKNAYETYEHLLQYDPFSVKDMLSAHRVLMDGLVKEVGMFRVGGVGVFAG